MGVGGGMERLSRREERATEIRAEGRSRISSKAAAQVRDRPASVGRFTVRGVSQVALRVPAQRVGAGGFERAVDEVLAWLGRKVGASLPAAARARRAFDMREAGAQRATAVVLNDPKFWACRFDDPDTSVASRTWVTEVAIGQAEAGELLIGCRLLCCSRGDDVRRYHRSVPALVKGVVARVGGAQLDGLDVTTAARRVESRGEVEWLVDLLGQDRRRSDVVVVSLPEGSGDPRKAMIDADRLQSRLQGIAHVFVLPGPASFDLSDAVGKNLSVFRQAVRIYRPGLRPWSDEQSRHPLFLAEGPNGWVHRANKLEDVIIEGTLERTVRGIAGDDDVPGFAWVSDLAHNAERARLLAEGASDAQLLGLFERENEDLKRQLEEQRREYEALLITAEQERDAAEATADGARATAFDRLLRIRTLEERLSASSESEDVTPIPGSLEGLEEWCREHLAGEVEVLRRATQAARKSDFADVELIYKALLLLRDAYVPMRRSPSPDRHARWQEGLKQLQLEDALTGDGPKYAPDDYSVLYGGQRRALVRHLKGRDSRDRKYGFRMYFFYDEEEGVAVVGHLPEHLDNRST